MHRGGIDPSVKQINSLYGVNSSKSFTIDPTQKYILSAIEANNSASGSTTGGVYFIDKGNVTLIWSSGSSISYMTVSVSGTTLTISCGNWLARYFPLVLTQLD